MPAHRLIEARKLFYPASCKRCLVRFYILLKTPYYLYKNYFLNQIYDIYYSEINEVQYVALR